MPALAVPNQGLFDLAERRQQPPAHRLGDVVAVALGGGHERLHPGDPQPLLRIGGLAEQVVHALERFGEGFGVRQIQGLQPLLEARQVELGMVDQVPNHSQEVVADPRPGEFESMGHLVQRHPGAELAPVQTPLVLEPCHVRDHEIQAAAGTGDRQVELPQHPLAEVTEYPTHLGAQEERQHPLHHHLHELTAPAARWQGRRGCAGLVGHGLAEAGRHGLDQVP